MYICTLANENKELEAAYSVGSAVPVTPSYESHEIQCQYQTLALMEL